MKCFSFSPFLLFSSIDTVLDVILLQLQFFAFLYIMDKGFLLFQQSFSSLSLLSSQCLKTFESINKGLFVFGPLFLFSESTWNYKSPAKKHFCHAEDELTRSFENIRCFSFSYNWTWLLHLSISLPFLVLLFCTEILLSL